MSIKEIPMQKWIDIYENKSFEPLLKKGKLCKRALDVYERLKDELIDNFGANDQYLKVLQNKINIELKYIEQIKTGDRSNQIFIDILEIQNKELLAKQGENTDLYDATIAMEEFYKREIDLSKITVFMFYKNINRIKNKIKDNGTKR